VSASASGISRDEEAAMSNMDVSLEESNKTDDFQSNSPIENIWTIDHDDEANHMNLQAKIVTTSWNGPLS